MAINQLQIPSYAAPQSLDFSSLANLGQVYQKAQQDHLRQQTLASLGQGGQDAQTLLQSGDLTLAQLGVQMQNRQSDQERQVRQDAFQREESARSQQNADRSFGLQQRASARADEGPVETASQRALAARANGVDPNTPAGKAYILTGKLPEGDTSFTNTIEQRKQAALSNGLDPSSPGFQSFVLTGKMPREDAQPLTATDKKAVLEADEKVQAGQLTIENLAKAKVLSKQALAGPMAGKLGYAASFLGDSSDIGKAGIATQDLENLVTTNALGQLKTIFGGNPTEGERGILLDIQGSVGKPDAVRQKVFDRAIEAANKRLTFEKQRADSLRGGTFYKNPNATPATVTPPTAPGPQQQGITQEQYAALPSGTPYTAPDGSQRIKP